jgi:pyruvate formate lyase activating enzyme
VAVCPTGARQMVGQTMGVDEVLAGVLRDRIFYDDSGGGITFSGGEPLLQVAFLRGLLEACRSAQLHTAVDTCGYARRETLLQVAELTDLFLYDLKVIDEDLHREATGVSNTVILDNLKVLGQRGARIWIRVPIIPGWNDSDKQLTAAARIAASVAGVEQVQLLPYHELGRHKAPETAAAAGEPPPSPAQLERAADRFRAFGLSARIGG